MLYKNILQYSSRIRDLLKPLRKQCFGRNVHLFRPEYLPVYPCSYRVKRVSLKKRNYHNLYILSGNLREFKGMQTDDVMHVALNVR